MKVMISIVSKEEALVAYDNKAELIDIKNPLEGSLGAQSPLVVKEIVEALPKDAQTSATVGDVPFLPCTVAQAAYAVASMGVNYVKVGIKGCKTKEEVNQLCQQVGKAVSCFEGTDLVVGCYGDYRESGTINPFEALEGIEGTPVKGVLIDTLIKDGRNLFDFMKYDELDSFIKKVHEKGFLCALAGSIKMDHIPALRELKADITGVRGAICDGSRMGTLKPDMIQKFVKETKVG